MDATKIMFGLDRTTFLCCLMTVLTIFAARVVA
jgi:hypothetical protein